jgi:hypothetical protein
MHQLMPIVIVLDWLIDPPRHTLSTRKALYWLLFPLAYLGYTLTRGPHTGWYPYPFLTPTTHGYLPVIENCAAIAIGLLILIAVVTRIGNSLGRRLANRHALQPTGRV